MNETENGKKLRQLRGDKSAKDVSEALGISMSALLMYERGERNPRDNIKIKLAHYYDTTIEDLFFAS